jgi:hypothetical protein
MAKYLYPILLEVERAQYIDARLDLSRQRFILFE